MFDETKKVQEKNIISSRELEQFAKLPTAKKHEHLKSYHHLNKILPYTAKEIATIPVIPPPSPRDGALVYKYFDILVVQYHLYL